MFITTDKLFHIETSAKLFIFFAHIEYISYLYGMKQKLSSPSFADIFLGQRKVKQRFFSQINTVIDWAPIRAIIEVAYTKGYKSTGRPGYDSLVLFKIELLRTWYGLSDGEVEDQVNDRLSFSRFAGLGMEDAGACRDRYEHPDLSGNGNFFLPDLRLVFRDGHGYPGFSGSGPVGLLRGGQLDRRHDALGRCVRRGHAQEEQRVLNVNDV